MMTSIGSPDNFSSMMVTEWHEAMHWSMSLL
jgi:hypothetical protein